MGKKSVRENKNIYQQSRENRELTREAASDLMQYVSADRIEKIESERSLPHPDEILAMADCYKAPELCNYYCSHECPIGIQHVPEIESKDLATVTLELLSLLNTLDSKKNRLIDISVDGAITEEEYTDFSNILNDLKRLNASISSLTLWIEKTVADGKIDREALEKALNG